MCIIIRNWKKKHIFSAFFDDIWFYPLSLSTFFEYAARIACAAYIRKIDTQRVQCISNEFVLNRKNNENRRFSLQKQKKEFIFRFPYVYSLLFTSIIETCGCVCVLCSIKNHSFLSKCIYLDSFFILPFCYVRFSLHLHTQCGSSRTERRTVFQQFRFFCSCRRCLCYFFKMFGSLWMYAHCRQ